MHQTADMFKGVCCCCCLLLLLLLLLFAAAAAAVAAAAAAAVESIFSSLCECSALNPDSDVEDEAGAQLFFDEAEVRC
jgi:hypothetical protein